MTKATATATTTCGVTSTPSTPVNTTANRMEVSGSRSLAAHMVPMHMPIAAAKFMPATHLRQHRLLRRIMKPKSSAKPLASTPKTPEARSPSVNRLPSGARQRTRSIAETVTALTTTTICAPTTMFMLAPRV